MFNHKIPVTLPEGYVDFFKGLESWENEEQIRIRKIYSPIKKDLIKMLEESKKPLIQQLNSHIDVELYQDVFLRLLEYLKISRPEVTPNIEEIETNLSKVDFPEIIRSFLHMKLGEIEKIADKAIIKPEFFFFVADHAFRPFLRLFAEPYAKELVDDLFYWDFPATCPICGSKSHFSRLKSETGQRFMFCDRCFSEWKVRYLYCVHCGHDKPGEIHYMNVENDDAFKLYLCDHCKGYLKTFDERPGGDMVDLFIANIETIYLDMLAQKEGYTSHDE